MAYAILVAFALAFPAAAQKPADEIQAMIGQYAAAVAANDTKLAAQVWSTTSDASMIHPGGHVRGWDQVRGDFYEKTMFALFSDRRLTVRDAVVHVNGSIAWAEFYWHFEARLKATGAPIQTDGRETQIYRRTGRHHWELVHVHYSGMPVAGR